MFKSIYLLALTIILVFIACDNLEISSGQADTFIKLYGSVGTDQGVDVKLFNGGYIILATVSNEDNDNTNIALLTVDRFGNLSSDNIDTLSSARGGNNTASRLLITNDGGFIALGTVVDTLNNNTDISINKFDASGEFEWEKIIGSNDNEIGSTIKETSSGYIIAGSTDAESSIGNIKGLKDNYIVKTDDSGNVEWTEINGGAGNQFVNDLVVISGGYLTIGTTVGTSGSTEISVVKYNFSGGVPDAVTYGGNNNDYGASITKVQEGGFVIIGNVEDASGSNSDIYAIKTEEDIHTSIWNIPLSENVLNDNGYKVINSNDGYILVGSKELSTGYAGYFLKIDENGDKLSENIIGGYGQIIYAIEPTYDGGYIMTGSSGVEGNEMISLIKVNSEGEL